MKKSLAILGLIGVLTTGVVLAKGNEARVRVVHASPDAPSVDVLVNDAIRAFEDVMFPEVTEYASLPADMYNFKVVPKGGDANDAVIDADANLFYNTDYTVIAVETLDNIEPLVLVDDNRPAAVVKSRVRFVHASPDAPAVDIRVMDGPYLWQNVDFKEVGDYLTVPQGMYDLEVLVAGTETVALTLPAVMLEGGTTYTVYAVGLLAGNPDLGVQVSVDNENPAKFRRFGPRNPGRSKSQPNRR